MENLFDNVKSKKSACRRENYMRHHPAFGLPSTRMKHKLAKPKKLFLGEGFLA